MVVSHWDFRRYQTLHLGRTGFAIVSLGSSSNVNPIPIKISLIGEIPATLQPLGASSRVPSTRKELICGQLAFRPKRRLHRRRTRRYLHDARNNDGSVARPLGSRRVEPTIVAPARSKKNPLRPAIPRIALRDRIGRDEPKAPNGRSSDSPMRKKRPTNRLSMRTRKNRLPGTTPGKPGAVALLRICSCAAYGGFPSTASKPGLSRSNTSGNSMSQWNGCHACASAAIAPASLARPPAPSHVCPADK